MMELMVGIVVGAVGMMAKDKFIGNESEQKVAAKQRELDNMYAENEKISKQKKEMERQVEDLLTENQKLKRQYKDKDTNLDDLTDQLDNAQKEVKKLCQQNDTLCRKVQEYKTACENYEIEVECLKEKQD